MQTKLTRSDFAILLEALGKWEQADVFGSMMGAMLGGMIPTEERAKWEAEQAEKDKLEKQGANDRKEMAIMLKAKLLQMRDASEITTPQPTQETSE